ncbi:anti-sigma factor [Rhizocola hellebori]|uniref:Anti-sigma factor n=1 Tax=Rhizocola hellebori TaxID=1392758 RepID=A0A8J3QIP9_9ACTN|nr:zf-HC2 domain-containing protein [Rhizocola hellebori]GIH10742.1 anti-sigma factor [Rhizocola hellebori]
MSCEFVQNDGAYVLGALAPAERADYEQHLATCVCCREAVASIAVLPGLLRRLTPLQTQEPLPSTIDRLPKLVHSLGIIRAKQRHRQRWQVFGSAMVAAGLVLAVALGVMSLRPSDTTPPFTMPSPTGPVMIPMTQVVVDTAVTAEVGLTETRGGVVVVMHCAYPLSSGHTKPYTFRLFALGTDGVAEQLGSWMAGPGDDVIMSGMSRYDLADLVRLELRGRDGTTVLAYDLA